jgi:pentatricopeptide repeat protein
VEAQLGHDSRFVFYSVELKNVYLWNSLIIGYVKKRVYNEVFDLFNEICCSDEMPDDYTLAMLAKASGEIGDSVAGKLIHGKSLWIGFLLDTVAANSLMRMYCKCVEFSESRNLFDEMPKRN